MDPTTRADSPLATAVRQWGVRLLRQYFEPSGPDEETVLRVILHAGELSERLGVSRGEAIRAAFGESEPVTIEEVSGRQDAAAGG